MTGLSAPARRHAVGHGRDQSLDSQELAVADLEQLANLERKRLVEGRVHWMDRTVIVGDGFVFAGVVETNERPYQAAFFVDHGITALLHFGDDLGEAGRELRAAGYPADLLRIAGIVRGHHAVLDALAVRVERSHLV